MNDLEKELISLDQILEDESIDPKFEPKITEQEASVISISDEETLVKEVNNESAKVTQILEDAKKGDEIPAEVIKEAKTKVKAELKKEQKYFRALRHIHLITMLVLVVSFAIFALSILFAGNEENGGYLSYDYIFGFNTVDQLISNEAYTKKIMHYATLIIFIALISTSLGLYISTFSSSKQARSVAFSKLFIAANKAKRHGLVMVIVFLIGFVFKAYVVFKYHSEVILADPQLGITNQNSIWISLLINSLIIFSILVLAINEMVYGNLLFKATSEFAGEAKVPYYKIKKKHQNSETPAHTTTNPVTSEQKENYIPSNETQTYTPVVGSRSEEKGVFTVGVNDDGDIIDVWVKNLHHGITQMDSVNKSWEYPKEEIAPIVEEPVKITEEFKANVIKAISEGDPNDDVVFLTYKMAIILNRIYQMKEILAKLHINDRIKVKLTKSHFTSVEEISQAIIELEVQERKILKICEREDISITRRVLTKNALKSLKIADDNIKEKMMGGLDEN